MTRDDLLHNLQNNNLLAFLRVIRAGETSQDDAAYQTMFGGGLFDAPPWQHPRQVNHAKGYSSTAAGAYQFLATTWDEMAAKYGLADFSPPNQDLAAVGLIARRGALQDVLDGRLDAAIRKCGREWASLPGSPYGQPMRTLAQAHAVYEAHGGRIDAAVAIPSTPEAKPMGAVLALLPSLISLIPQLGQLFGSGSEVQQRNVAAASVVANAVVQATQSENLQGAIEKLQADPAALQAAKDAVSEILPQLMDVGGGVETARKFAADHETGRYGRILEIVTYSGLFFLLLANAAAFAFAWKTEDFSIMADVKQADIGVALIVFGFWLGTSISSKRKDEARGVQ